jgi:protein-disulfide isomerase
MSSLRRLARVAVAALPPLLAGFAAAPPTASAANALSEAQRQEVRDLVRSTLVENPAILAEAVAALRVQQAEKEREDARAAIAAQAEALFHAAADPVLGNPDGDVTVVEFFDYRCGYCKSVFGMLMDTVAADGGIRLVLKEFPVLGEDSTLAARWSLAAHGQGRYAAFHTALMGHRGAITEDVLRGYAAAAGLDVETAAKDAASQAVTDTLQANRAQALSLGVHGTPAFIIGRDLLPGAIDAATLSEAVAAARKEG